MQKQHQTLRIVIIVICLAILGSGGFRAITFGTVGEGYTTGYEGAKAQFYGIEWNFEDQHGKQPFTLKGTTFSFDPDNPMEGCCNLAGEMTSVFLPRQSQPARWVDPEWWSKAFTYIKNPVEHHEWQIEDGDTTILYAMDEYILKWYFSISAEWDYKTTVLSSQNEVYNQRYRNTDIWFEFNLQPIWYFEGSDTCYFSIAKIRVSDIALGGKLGEDREDTTESEQCRVDPESEGSILSIYYNPYGQANERAEKEPYVFKGKKLNPDLFTDKVYAYYKLVDFGTKFWTEWLVSDKWKGDVVTVGFDFHVFVVGEWKVQDIQEIPEDYGRTSKTGEGGLNFLEQIARLLAGPEFKIWFILGMIALIVLVLAIFFPWVLFSLLGLYRYSKQK